MATLTWGDVVLIGLVGCIGFTLAAYWASAWMAKRNISGQVKGKPPSRPAAAEPPAPSAPKAPAKAVKKA
jgi:hypothetical protein